MHPFLRSLLAAAAALTLPAAAQLPQLGDDRPRLPGRIGPGLACVQADFDGDGLVDLARLTAAGLDVLLQRPSGAYQRVGNPLTPQLPATVAVVTLAAGRLSPRAAGPDLVLGLSGASSQWLRNAGGGQFTLVPGSPFPRPAGFSGATTQVQVADFDQQGTDDVLVLHDGAGPQLFLANAVGGFTEVNAPFPPAFLPQSPVAAVADFDGTAGPDVVLVQRGSGLPPVLWTNNGFGGFAPVTGAFTGWSAFPVSQVRAGFVDRNLVPDLVLAPSSAAGGRLRILLFDRLRGVFRAAASSVALASGVVDLALADLDGDRFGDLLLLERDGVVSLALQSGGAFGTRRPLLPAGPRAKLGVVDLEADGDLDVYALGFETEDRLLLGDGSGALLETEENSMPLGVVPAPLRLAALDVTDDGDPDLVGYAANGEPLAYANDGAARFTPRPGLLPRLAGASVRAVRALALTTAQPRDLAVLSTPPGGGGLLYDVRVLVAVAGGGLRDETATRWRGPNGVSYDLLLTGDALSFSAGQTLEHEIVTVDSNGALRLFVARGGVYGASSAAFAVVGPVAGATALALGDVDGDGFPDLVVGRSSGTPVVLRGSATGTFTRVVTPVLGGFPAQDVALLDADGDGLDDLFVLSPGRSPQLSYLRAVGNGGFINATATGVGAPPADATTLAVLPSPEPGMTAALVVGSTSTADQLQALRGGQWLAAALPARGSAATDGFVVEDLDLDGDHDLVVVRRGHQPRVLFDRWLQTSQVGVTQLGRPALLRVSVPGPGAAVLLLGLQSRQPLPPYGLLRLSPALLVEAGRITLPLGGSAEVALPTSLAWPAVTVGLQAAVVDALAGSVRLSNLEQFRLVRF